MKPQFSNVLAQAGDNLLTVHVLGRRASIGTRKSASTSCIIIPATAGGSEAIYNKDVVASNCRTRVNVWQCNAQYSCFKNDVCMQGLSKLMIQVKKVIVGCTGQTCCSFNLLISDRAFSPHHIASIYSGGCTKSVPNSNRCVANEDTKGVIAAVGTVLAILNCTGALIVSVL